MESRERNFKLRFVDGRPDRLVEISDALTVEHLIRKLQEDLQTIKHIRLIAAGRELLPEIPLSKINGDTLHCIVTDFTPQYGRKSTSKSKAQNFLTTLESLDPGVVLLWICGGVLATFWLVFFWDRERYGDHNLMMLAFLTLGFPFLCITMYLNGPQTIHISSNDISAQGSPGRSNGRSQTTDDWAPPPRPSAPLRRLNASS